MFADEEFLWWKTVALSDFERRCWGATIAVEPSSGGGSDFDFTGRLEEVTRCGEFRRSPLTGSPKAPTALASSNLSRSVSGNFSAARGVVGVSFSMTIAVAASAF